MSFNRNPGEPAHRIAGMLLAICLVCAGAECVIRGPLRFAQAHDFNDFISPYVQTRAWIQGNDPYSPRNLVEMWPPEAKHFDFLSRNLADGTLVTKRGIPSAYPLSAFVLIAPIAVLPWHVAHTLWLIITALSLGLTAASLLSAANLLPWSLRSFGFLSLTLGLAPFHTALATGNIVTVAVAASAAGVWAAGQRRDALAGILFAISVGLKPQIGLPFCFYYLVSKRWRIPAIAGALVALLFAIALIRSAAGGAPWLQNYLYDNRILFTPGSVDDFTERNPVRFGLVNFQVAAYALTQSRTAAIVAALAMAGAAGVTWLWQATKQGRASDSLLPLSTLAVISLLPVYHRFYDATLLVYPLAWSLAAFNGPLRTTARSTLGLIAAIFLVPGGTILEQMQHTGRLGTVGNHWWGNVIVLPHESWSLAVLSLLLLRAFHRQNAIAKPASPVQHLS